MEKQIFKVGDRVFDIRFGWGEIILHFKKEPFPNYMCVRVGFDDENISNKDYTYREAVLLSFTEYTLQGFSQERPINYEDYIGKWGKFWNVPNTHCIVSKLDSHHKDYDHPFKEMILGDFFAYFQPLTEEQIKILGLE